MNKPAKIAGTETVEDVLTKMDETRSTNLRIWNALSKTDPKHTKGFSRAGGFRGTAIKPIWITQRLTELFGPCGMGWGTSKPEFQLVPGNGVELLVFCTVEGWYIEPGTERVATVYGVGGDKVITQFTNKVANDDEAFKKASTDAISNAFKFVGVGADVHMGLFDDSKYVREVAEEFRPKPDNPTTGEPKPRERVKLDGPYTCPTQLMTAARQFVHTLEGIGDSGELYAFLETEDAKAFCIQLERDMPAWWSTGEDMPAEFIPLEIRIANKKREMDELETIRR